ncbi:MAG: DUF1549 and DUF1553 domain-containing protein [Verrucomicrobiia bacterium]|jgi:hypothetical protein
MASPAGSEGEINWPEARQFWAFQKPVRHDPPPATRIEWARERLDHFILARMEAANLSPAPAADRRTWIRRATFGLTGLPPTPGEIDSFLEDNIPEAFEKVADRLLASPRFGERLTSLWLTIARYAEDQAHQVGGRTEHYYPNAHLYRAWVIDAFNRDLPYDEFIRLQLSADTAVAKDSPDRAALGFLGLGHKYYSRGRLEVMADEWEDRVDTVSRAFLGLTVACARCHTHKFDPITTADYHAMAGIFASTKMLNEPIDPEKYAKEKDKNKKPLHSRHVVADGALKDLTIFIRGDVENKGPVVKRGFLQVLSTDARREFKKGSGRQQLAEAISDPGNPLTARVIVNRIWKRVFGQALVNTPSNFGKLGERPSHPLLLDDLSARFMTDGWSLKSLVREMILSATYRQRADNPNTARQQDAENRYYSRIPRRRLDIEQFRDALLFVSGQLEDREGRSLELSDPKNRRRTVYGRISRNELNSLMMQFDYPDANVHAADRSTTTTPIQKLWMMNNPFVIEQAKQLARLLKSFDRSTARNIRNAYERLYGREPTSGELQLGISFLSDTDDSPADMTVWEQYAQILMTANEFLYVD